MRSFPSPSLFRQSSILTLLFFARCRSSRSLVMKSTIFPEWWTKRIMPVRRLPVFLLVFLESLTALFLPSHSRSGTSASFFPSLFPLLPILTLPSPRSYVPIKSDYSDLLDVSAFFIGGPDGSNAHDLLAKRIGLQGKKWADEHFREADIAAYLFRLCAFCFLSSSSPRSRTAKCKGAGFGQLLTCPFLLPFSLSCSSPPPQTSNTPVSSTVTKITRIRWITVRRASRKKSSSESYFIFASSLFPLSDWRREESIE